MSIAYPNRLRTVLRLIHIWRNSMLANIGMGVLLSIAAIMLVVWVTPAKHVNAFGQVVTESAQPGQFGPGGSISISEGSQPPVYSPEVHIFGFWRPSISLTPEPSEDLTNLFSNSSSSVQARDGAGWTLATGLLRWAGLASLFLAVIMWLILWRRFCRMRASGHSKRRAIVAVVIIAAMVALAWGGSIVQTMSAAAPLTHSSSLRAMFGEIIVPPMPSVTLPKEGVKQYSVAVIGDSRVSRVGGELVANPSLTDRACGRSRDSLAVMIQALTRERTLNLACPSASIMQGLLGAEPRDGMNVPPQVLVLQQLKGVKTVIVMIGPNDVWWSTQLGLCYVQVHCFDNLTNAAFQSAMDQFAQDYVGTSNSLLQQLHDLPGRPQVIVNLSYSPFDDNANCRDTQGPKGVVGLNKTGGRPDAKIIELKRRNYQLNSILTAGAELMGFQTSMAPLTPLCTNDPIIPVPDIQGINSDNPFHPTWHGEELIAYGDAILMHAATSAPKGTSPGS